LLQGAPKNIFLGNCAKLPSHEVTTRDIGLSSLQREGFKWGEIFACNVAVCWSKSGRGRY